MEEDHAEICFQSFGDRVKHWITFNEPLVVSQLAYGTGAFAPGHTSDRDISQIGDTAREPWRVLHSQLLAHGHAARAYRSLDQGGQIGITFNADWAEPYSGAEEDRAAAARKLDFFVAVGADPIFGSGDYPESCKTQLGSRLPSFSEEEKMLVKGSADFIGINHYTTNYIRQDPNSPSDTDFMGNVVQTFTGPNGKEIGPSCGVNWVRVVPWGFRKILRWAYHRYRIPIHVTENGIPYPGEATLALPDVLDDQHRIEYHAQYLDEMRKAIVADQVDIRSYFAWSLMDNWEWADGFRTRFGVTYVEKGASGNVINYWPKKSANSIRDWFGAHLSRESIE